jgi:hypothetical protein
MGWWVVLSAASDLPGGTSISTSTMQHTVWAKRIIRVAEGETRVDPGM